MTRSGRPERPWEPPPQHLSSEGSVFPTGFSLGREDRGEGSCSSAGDVAGIAELQLPADRGSVDAPLAAGFSSPRIAAFVEGELDHDSPDGRSSLSKR